MHELPFSPYRITSARLNYKMYPARGHLTAEERFAVPPKMPCGNNPTQKQSFHQTYSFYYTYIAQALSTRNTSLPPAGSLTVCYVTNHADYLHELRLFVQGSHGRFLSLPEKYFRAARFHFNIESERSNWFNLHTSRTLLYCSWNAHKPRHISRYSQAYGRGPTLNIKPTS